MNEDVLELIEDLQADEYKQGFDWKGYRVYEPIYKENPCVGPPLVVLEKNNDVRYSSIEECFEYLDYKIKQESQFKTVAELRQDIKEDIQEEI